MRCENCEALRRELAEVIRQLKEAREAADKATDLMIRGEALRDRMLLASIVGKTPMSKEGRS